MAKWTGRCLEPLNLVARNALVLQHHWNSVIYPIDVQPVPGDQSFCKQLFDWAVIGLTDLAGGYGVMQQRAEMQEEIRRLQSNLATAANPKGVFSITFDRKCG